MSQDLSAPGFGRVCKDEQPLLALENVQVYKNDAQYTCNPSKYLHFGGNVETRQISPEVKDHPSRQAEVSCLSQRHRNCYLMVAWSSA